MQVNTSVAQVLDFLDNIKDEEILANSSKIIRIVLRDDKVCDILPNYLQHYDKVTSLHSDLGNTLLKAMEKYSFSEVVLVELMAGFRNFTRSAQKVTYISKNQINIVVSMALKPPNDK